MAKETFIKPTESELEILQVLWQKKQATVREIHTILEQYKTAGYTTTLKLMQIMYEKGLVQRDETNRTHIYKALLPQYVAQKHLLHKMIHSLYEGNASSMVLQVLGEHSTTPEEIAEIETFIQKMKQK